uniref:NADH dehydrogenase subunit 4L n=1 Tax=Gnathostomula paradoxa TaxID=66783 RepID=A0A0F6Q183_9BILA|nr:NADH dehydrogenase subunit 4L [Gnathostomula paradoxa]AKD00034.1 NADH dehydrogenase subunit 4L [Gnathostomula paradoxa]
MFFPMLLALWNNQILNVIMVTEFLLMVNIMFICFTSPMATDSFFSMILISMIVMYATINISLFISWSSKIFNYKQTSTFLT